MNKAIAQTGEIGMKSFDVDQSPDTPSRKSTDEGIRDLTQRELKEIAGGPGAPGTAGDGNGRLAWMSVEK